MGIENETPSSVTLSVVMPVYNAEKYFNNTIESILNQTYEDFELIIVDDGSTDQSLSLARSYAKTDRRVNVYHTENHGVSQARNYGIGKTTGKWIQFVDADDILELDMFEKMARIAEFSDGDIIVSGVIKEITSTHQTIVQKFDSCDLNGRSEIAEFLKIMTPLTRDMFLNYLWNRWINSDIIKINSIKFFQEVSLGEDFLFNCECIKVAKRLMITNDAFYHYYLRGSNSLRSVFYENELERRLLIYHANINLYESFGILEDSCRIIQINEGRYSWSSLSKIKSQNCKLSKEGKIKYLDGFLNSELKECLLQYAKSERSLKGSIKHHFISIGNVKALYWLLQRL